MTGVCYPCVTQDREPSAPVQKDGSNPPFLPERAADWKSCALVRCGEVCGPVGDHGCPVEFCRSFDLHRFDSMMALLGGHGHEKGRTMKHRNSVLHGMLGYLPLMQCDGMRSDDVIADAKPVGAAAGTTLLPPAFLILCVAVAVRTIHLGDLSLWTDELFSRYYAELFGFQSLWTTGLGQEDTPPLYYLALQGWMWLFGTSEVAMRSLSLVASVLALPLVYALGKELFDERRGLIGAAILALSPMQVKFAQEARAYALLLLPVGVVLLAIARFLRGERRGPTLLLYGVGAVIGIYCHATAAFFIAACNIVVVAYILTDPSLNRLTVLLQWIGTNTVVAIIAIPEFIGMLTLGGKGVEWNSPFGPGDVVRSLSSLVSGMATPVRLPGVELTLAVLLSATACVIESPPRRPAFATIIAIPLLFTALIAVASLVYPIFFARVLFWLGIPLAVVIADAITKPSRLRTVLQIAVLLTGVIGVGYQFSAATNEPFRELLEELRPELAQADHVVLAPLTDPTAFAYYAPEITRLESWDIGPRDTIENDAMRWRMGVQVVTLEHTIHAIRSGQSVWLVLRMIDRTYVTPLLAQLPPPRIDIERDCGRKFICLAAMAW
jgi:mannosyltransferase